MKAPDAPERRSGGGGAPGGGGGASAAGGSRVRPDRSERSGPSGPAGPPEPSERGKRATAARTAEASSPTRNGAGAATGRPAGGAPAADGTGTAAPAPASGGGEPAERRYRSLVLAVVMMGVTITAIDTTIVVLGLPVMMADLHSDMVSMVWVIMAYLLTITVLGTQVGRFGDIYGRARMYNLGLAIFTLGSLCCGMASTAPALIGFRVLQAVGGAFVSANSGAIIADTVPAAERGRAYGLTAIGWSAGAMLGILLGGVLITFVNWRYIFFINLPIGVAALLIGVRALRDRSPRVRQRIDLPGVALLAVGLLAVLTALTGTVGTGWTPATGAVVAAGCAVLAGFVAWERACPAPMLDLSLLRDRVLSASIVAAFFQALGSFAVMFLIIMYLQGVRGLSPLDAALMLLPGYTVGGFLGPWSGRIADRRGARLPASIGLALQAAGVLIYAALTPISPYWQVIVAALVNGVGASFYYPANSSAVMANAPRGSYGVASGLLRTFSNIGMVGSFAVALLAAASAIPRAAALAIFIGTSRLSAETAAAFNHGLRSALLTSIALIGAAFVLSVLRGREVRGSGGRA